MKVELKNLIDFINNPPQSLIEVYRENGLTEKQIQFILLESEILVTSFFALTKNRMLQATKPKPKAPKLSVVMGGRG